MPRPPKTPSYRQHKPTNQACVTFSGRTHYLGKFNSPESRRRYAALLGEWTAAGEQLPPRLTADITVAQLAVAYLNHADEFYRAADGTPTGEAERLRFALRPLNRLYSKLPASEFSPLKLRAVRDEMIKMGWVRTNINRQVHRIRGMFRWAVSHEMLPPGCNVHEMLKTVEALKRGRSKAIESDPVKPVAAAMIDAVLPLVSAQVGAMIRLQLLTGMRPAEVCMMRTADITPAVDVWTYTPATHKNAHRGKVRTIYLGPQAQEILRPWLSEPARRDAFIFSPAQAEAARLETLAKSRPTRTPSHVRRMLMARRRRRQRGPKDRYDVATYRRAIARACDLAFALPTGLATMHAEFRKWEDKWSYAHKSRPRLAEMPDAMRETYAAVECFRAKHRWSPHQLRHNAATELRRRFGIEAASVVLGHATPAVTEIYAERDEGSARRIMGQVG